MMHARTELGRLLQKDQHVTIAALTRIETFLAGTDGDRIASINAPGVRVLVSDLHRLVESEVEWHLDFEERVLFPLLEERGAHGLTAPLADEHGWIRPLACCLRRLCATALQDGFSEESWAAFKGLAQAFSVQMLSHLRHEETTLLEAVDKAFDPATAPGLDRRLAEAFRTAQGASPTADYRLPTARRAETLAGWVCRPGSTGSNQSPSPEC